MRKAIIVATILIWQRSGCYQEWGFQVSLSVQRIEVLQPAIYAKLICCAGYPRMGGLE